MDVSKLIRNPVKVQDTLMEKNQQLITRTGCKIYVPESYTNKGLAVIGNEVSILGIFAMIINGGYYSVSTATSMMVITPSLTEIVEMDGVPFFEFTFDPGSVVIKNTYLVKNKKLVNYIMDYFVDYGHSPWFINYVDHAEIFKNAAYFNDIRLAKNQAVLDIITAHISRDPNKFDVKYRHSIKNADGLYIRPNILPTRDIANNTTSNLARINGSELAMGIKAALTAQPTRLEPLEDLIKG